MSGEAREPASMLFDRARTAVSKIQLLQRDFDGLQHDFDGALGMAQRALAREALSRTE